MNKRISDNTKGILMADGNKTVHEKRGERGKRKADVVRPGPIYKIVDAIVTIAGLALVGAIVVYVIMIFS